jgi:serine phosphatase RsbU (regulator of sigma subunit)
MSTQLRSIDPLLLRQLSKVGITDLDALPDNERWAKLLQRISDYYRSSSEDRDLLARTLDLSTKEMNELNDRLHKQHHRLNDLINAIADALSAFRGIHTGEQQPDEDSLHDVTVSITQAKSTFNARLNDLFNVTDGTQVDSGSLSMIRQDFLSLADGMMRLIRDASASASMRKELEVARAVQQLLLPESETIDRPFVRVTGHYRPATSCGGDWWAVHDLPDGRVFLVIGDVTGHGVASAILTGVAKAACDIARNLRKNDLQCDELLRMMNTSIYGAGKQRLMTTASVCMIDPRSKKLTVSSAGHTFPMLIRNRGGQLTAAPIVAHGSPLGASPDSVFPEVTVPLESNDVLCCYTDGVTECESPLKEQFSERRLRELLIHAGRWDPSAIRDTIEHSLAQFAGDAPQIDDITFIIAKVGMLG